MSKSSDSLGASTSESQLDSSEFKSFVSSDSTTSDISELPAPFADYLDELRDTLDSDLFSEDLLDYLHIPKKVDNQKELDDVIKTLKDNTKEWLNDTHFNRYKIEAIKTYSKDNELFWINRLFNKDVFNSENQDILETHINQKIQRAHFGIKLLMGISKAGLIAGYTLLCIVFIGIPLNRFSTIITALFTYLSYYYSNPIWL